MRIFLKIVTAVGLTLALAIVSAAIAGRFFVKDMIEMHGGALLGSPVQVDSVSIDWAARKLVFNNLCIAGVENTSLFCAGDALVQFSHDFMPAWQRASIFPDLWVVEALEIKNASIVYDVDSEGDNFHSLRLQISEMSSGAVRDRLNAKAQVLSAPLLLQVKIFQISNIRVDARSQKNPSRARNFVVGDMAWSDIGVQEGGVAAAEVLDQITRAIVDRVQGEAVRQGVVDVKRQADTASRRPRQAEDENEVPDSNDGSTAGKAVRSIGSGFKKAGSELWQGTKKLFD